MANFVKVAQRTDIPEGKGKTLEINGKKIAVFHAAGKFYAIDDTCLHRGGPLGEGDLDGTTITCPWHGWEYDITSGCSLDDPSKKVASYATKVEGDDILVEC